MRTKIKKIFKYLQKYDYIKYILNKTIVPISNYIIDVQLDFEKVKLISGNTEIQKIFFEKMVLNGPFKGLQYPDLISFGSTLYPKLLGSYESELHKLIYNLLNCNYDYIIDIGCAEGYYTVGFALHSKCSNIIAYDIDEKALTQCKLMSNINNVGNKISFGKLFTQEDIKNFDLEKRYLIICDCEGYENILFDSSVNKYLKNCDLLIETHDIFNINISTNLNNIFKESHLCEIIYSVDDIQKAKKYNYSLLQNLDLKYKKILLEEQRLGIMEWHFYKSKNY